MGTMDLSQPIEKWAPLPDWKGDLQFYEGEDPHLIHAKRLLETAIRLKYMDAPASLRMQISEGAARLYELRWNARPDDRHS